MWTCLSAVPSSAVEPTTHREGCQSVLSEWPCLNKCEERITLDKLDFICALVARNLLQREPNLVKLFFKSWLVSAPGLQLAGLWNQGSVQWICWYGKETADKGRSNFAGAARNGACRGLGKKENKLLLGHLALQVYMQLYIKGDSNCVDFSWEGYFDALLQHLAFTELCKCFHFSLVLLESVAIRFMTVLLE